MSNERYIKNYINGTLMPAISGNYLDTINPATGKAYAQFPDSGTEDVEQAITYAEQALVEWQATESERRFRILMRIADIIEQNAIAYARAEAVDTGKPLAMSISQDIPGAQAFFRYYAGILFHFKDRAKQQESNLMHYRIRQAVGLVACILPPHMPLYSLCKKVAPALAMGNCVIVKPAQYTPMTAYLLARDLEHAGLPKGVLNIVQGKDESLIDALVQHPKIQAIAYTGRSLRGKQIIEKAATQHKKLALTMGGNNPNIIFADCNFDQMMIGTLRASFSNNGQLKHHASRILVQRDLYPKLKAELVKRAQFIKIGDPFAAITDLGALLSQDHLEDMEKLLQLAEVEGANLLCGGNRVEKEGELKGGYFFRPTVLENLPNTSYLNQKEIFGPLVTLQIFDTEEEALALANATTYGLSASIWTQDISKANRFAQRLRAKTIWINAWLTDNKDLSTGGIYGSNLASQGGSASLDFFSEAKEICVKY
ncbi:MAG: aldehyde dehydrogenase family protein [Bacteroidota bacterium]